MSTPPTLQLSMAHFTFTFSWCWIIISRQGSLKMSQNLESNKEIPVIIIPLSMVIVSFYRVIYVCTYIVSLSFHCYAPPLIDGSIKRCFFVWCMSVAYIGPKSRTERPRKTIIGTGVAHVTRESDTTFSFKVKRSRSPGRFTHRGLNASGSCSGERGNVLGVGTIYCYGAVCSVALGASAPTEGGQGWRHIVAATRPQLVTHAILLFVFVHVTIVLLIALFSRFV